MADLDIAAFLRARLDERERHANSWPDGVDYDENQFVLADVAAKRQIIDWCGEVVGDRDLTRYGEFGALKDDPDALAVTFAVQTLRLLALPYAGHPDYREDWKP